MLLSTSFIRRAVGAGLLLAPAGMVLAQAPVIIGLVPLANAHTAARSGPVTVSFSQPLTAGSAGALKVFSSQRGGLRTRSPGAVVNGSSLGYMPPAARPFMPGETVQTTVTTAAAGSGGNLARARVTQFTTAVGGPGTGSFLTAPASTNLQQGNNPQQVALGDLDNDGDLDYAVALYNSNRIGIRFNDGTGGFAPVPSGYQLPVVGQGPKDIVLADVDNDGDLDLLSASFGPTTTSGTTVSIRFNDGGGNFSAPANADPTVGDSPVSVAVGDVDGDGDLDFVAANYGVYFRAGTTVSVRLNLGQGLFVAPAVAPELPVGARPNSVALVDVDSDGDLDLLCANFDSGTVSVLLNDGTGLFTSHPTMPNPAVGAAPMHLTVGDVDGDGDPDLAVVNTSANTVSVRLNDGTGSFAPPTGAAATPVPVGINPQNVTLGDVDADGDLDMVVANAGTANAPSTHASLRLNNGAGLFTAPAVAAEAEPAVGSYSTGIALGDVDADGDLDMVVADFLYNTVSVRLNGVLTLGSRAGQPRPSLALLPNPSRAGTTVQAAGATAGAAVAVLDALGRAVASATADAAGTARLALPVGLAAGVYIVRSGGQVLRLAVE